VVLPDLPEERDGLLQVLLQEEVVFVVVTEGSGQISEKWTCFLRVLHRDPGPEPEPEPGVCVYECVCVTYPSKQARITAGWTEPTQHNNNTNTSACVSVSNTHSGGPEAEPGRWFWFAGVRNPFSRRSSIIPVFVLVPFGNVSLFSPENGSQPLVLLPVH